MAEAQRSDGVPRLGPGSRLGKYQIIRLLAKGGMAELYLARATSVVGFQKVLVIKRVLPELADNSDVAQMFLDEARLAATLQHANVVQTYDVGVVDGSYFMSMEFLQGEDVQSILNALALREEKLPIEHALQITSLICAGLHYAHEKSDFEGQPLEIVHRDVNPQNIIVTYDGGVKLIDFGVAKAADQATTTRHGTIKGKISYLSPEQCRCEPLDRRSDIFSLGILLYELTLRRKLFKGSSDFEILKQIAEEPIVPPREIDPHYSPALERIVMRALERDRERRYPTARAMQQDLEDLASSSGLFLAASKLEQFMERLFGAKIGAWKQAQARGVSLAEHLERSYEILSEEDAARPRVLTPDATDRTALSPGKLRPEAETMMDDRGRLASSPGARSGSLPGAALGALLAMVVILVSLYLAGAPAPATASTTTAPATLAPAAPPDDTTPAPPATPTRTVTPPPSTPGNGAPYASSPQILPSPRVVIPPPPPPAPEPATANGAGKPKHHHSNSNNNSNSSSSASGHVNAPVPLSELPRLTP